MCEGSPMWFSLTLVPWGVRCGGTSPPSQTKPVMLANSSSASREMRCTICMQSQKQGRNQSSEHLHTKTWKSTKMAVITAIKGRQSFALTAFTFHGIDHICAVAIVCIKSPTCQDFLRALVADHTTQPADLWLQDKIITGQEAFRWHLCQRLGSHGNKMHVSLLLLHVDMNVGLVQFEYITNQKMSTPCLCTVTTNDNPPVWPIEVYGCCQAQHYGNLLIPFNTVTIMSNH